MRKVRSDAVLLNLPEAQQAQLAEWLLGGMPYHQARELIAKEFGVEVKTLRAFPGFWREVCVPALLRRRSMAVETSEEIAQAAAAHPGQFDAATIDALKQKAFELSTSPQADPRDVKSLFMLVLKSRDQDLNERKITLLERKAAQADQAADVVKSELTAEEKQARLKSIFGMA
jgi:hypothetical protein